MAYFKINRVDILPYILQGGLKWTQNDVDSPQAGRTLDGLMHRGKVTSKVKIEVQCIPVIPSVAAMLFELLDHEYVEVETDIAPINHPSAMTMYNSTRPAACLIIDSQGTPRWDEIKFNLIQQ